jgi:hypothetical protein
VAEAAGYGGQLDDTHKPICAKLLISFSDNTSKYIFFIYLIRNNQPVHIQMKQLANFDQHDIFRRQAARKSWAGNTDNM